MVRSRVLRGTAERLTAGLRGDLYAHVQRLPLPWLEAKREYILCAGRPVGDPVVAYPSWLYEHRHMYPPPPNDIPVALD